MSLEKSTISGKNKKRQCMKIANQQDNVAIMNFYLTNSITPKFIKKF